MSGVSVNATLNSNQFMLDCLTLSIDASVKKVEVKILDTLVYSLLLKVRIWLSFDIGN